MPELLKIVWEILSIILRLNLLLFLIYGGFIKFYGKEIKIIEKFIKFIGEDQKRVTLYILSIVVGLFITIFLIP